MNAVATYRRCMVFIAVVLVVYVLQWARELLIPLAVAMLLADLLSPSLAALRRWHVPAGLASLLLTGLVAVIILGGVTLVSRQVLNVAGQLPDYRENIVRKIQSIRGAGRPLAKGITAVRDLSSEAVKTDGPTSQSTTNPTTQPVPVEVVPPKTQALTEASGAISPILFPLAQFGVLLTYLFFMLLNHDVIRHRARWMLRRSGSSIGQEVIEEASVRVGRYLRTQLAVNCCYGVLVFVIFLVLGLPNALLLAAIAALLRYVPYLGPVLAVTLPTLLGVAVFPGWYRPVILLGCILSVEGIVAGIVEPLLYGASTGVSSIGVVIATFFWAWVWGPVGLILAMPITVWIVIVGRHIPGFRSLALLLGSDPITEVEKRVAAREEEKSEAPKKA